MPAHESPLLHLTISGPPVQARALLSAIEANADALGIKPLSPMLHAALDAIDPGAAPQLFFLARDAGPMEARHA